MVGALTVGSALPHLINGIGGLLWQLVVVAASASTLLGGMIALLLVCDGPFPFPRLLRAPLCASCLRRSRRPPGQPGLLRAHVGAVRDVVVICGVLGESLRASDPAGPTRAAAGLGTFVVIARAPWAACSVACSATAGDASASPPWPCHLLHLCRLDRVDLRQTPVARPGRRNPLGVAVVARLGAVLRQHRRVSTPVLVLEARYQNA